MPAAPDPSTPVAAAPATHPAPVFAHTTNNPFTARFEHEATARGLAAIRTCEWAIEGGLENLPGRPIVHFTCERNRYAEVIYDLGDGLFLLRQNDDDVGGRIAAPTAAACIAIRDRISRTLTLRRAPEEETTVRTWWQASHGGANSRSRGVPTPAWSEIRDGYPAAVRDEFERLCGWTCGPPTGGRLVLWHGPPGTGKTTAVRALARAWRDWADVQLVSDPERLLASTGYLHEVLAPETGRRPPGVPRPRDWRLLVLEDAGEFLVPDAREAQGQALSRLLNVCDGLLGQTFRVLVLVTTNEPVSRMHPALVRPGRCVSNVDFTAAGDRRGRGVVRRAPARTTPRRTHDRRAARPRRRPTRPHPARARRLHGLSSEPRRPGGGEAVSVGTRRARRPPCHVLVTHWRHGCEHPHDPPERRGSCGAGGGGPPARQGVELVRP